MSKLEKDKEEDKIFELIKRINNSEITIAKNTDFLRFSNFDITVIFSFTDVIKLIESSFSIREKGKIAAFRIKRLPQLSKHDYC